MTEVLLYLQNESHHVMCYVVDGTEPVYNFQEWTLRTLLFHSLPYCQIQGDSNGAQRQGIG